MREKDQHFCHILTESMTIARSFGSVAHVEYHVSCAFANSLIAATKQCRVSYRKRQTTQTIKTIRTDGAIKPGFTAHAVREPPVGASRRDVHDHIKRLIKRRGRRPVHPRIRRRDRLGPVGDKRREVAPLEERLVERYLQHLVQPRVDVDPDELLVPLDRVRVEALVVRLPTVVPPAVGLGDAVEPGERTPVEGPTNDITASGKMKLYVNMGR